MTVVVHTLVLFVVLVVVVFVIAIAMIASRRSQPKLVLHPLLQCPLAFGWVFRFLVWRRGVPVLNSDILSLYSSALELQSTKVSEFLFEFLKTPPQCLPTVHTRDDQTHFSVDQVEDLYNGYYTELGKAGTAHKLTIDPEPRCGSEHCCFVCTFNDETYVVRFKKDYQSDKVYRFNNKQYQQYRQNYSRAQQFINHFNFKNIQLVNFIVVQRSGVQTKHHLILEAHLSKFQSLTNVDSYKETHRRIVSTTYDKLRRLQLRMYTYKEPNSVDHKPDALIDLQGVAVSNGDRSAFILADLEFLNSIDTVSRNLQRAKLRQQLEQEFTEHYDRWQKSGTD
mmetsp:Transcript_21421/g.36580  ORF Transcript_21421/g.36580 Transcript_21421/m.36580 type:complete len:337 (+) Transcript_21421:52-1062(+)